MSKTTKALRFDNLFMEYKILKRIDAATAADNFEELLDDLIAECANALYNGDIDNVSLHRALWKNLVSDKRTRFNNPERYFNGYLPEKSLKLELVELIATILPESARMAAPKVADPSTGKLSKSYWQYTAEDILAITDEAVLKSVYNNMASAKSKETILANAMIHYGLDYEATKATLTELQTLARECMKKLEVPSLSTSLIDKIQGGKHVMLSAAEIEELQRLLGK